MSKPIIGITSGILVDNTGMFPGYRRIYVNEDYINSLVKNGAVPMIIPLTAHPSIIAKQLEMVDGLILTGGNDINPLKYHQEPEQKLGELFPERDDFEYEVLRMAKKRKLPILGICRGAQLINVYHGGTLCQDLSYRNKKTIKHWQSHNPSQVTHSVDITPNTKLENILGNQKCVVNSFHHQVIQDIAEGLTISAIAKDGVIEAIEDDNYDFLIGIQWHPEMLYQSNPLMNLIFKSLISHSKGEN